MPEVVESRVPKGKENTRKLQERCAISLITLTSVVFIVLWSGFYANTTPEDDASRNLSLPKKHFLKKKLPQVQPNCTMEEYVLSTLREISSELYLRSVSCAPEDVHNVVKHTVPNAKKKPSEARGNIVIYVAVGLLLSSLVVAFLDVYKVKGKPSKSKPQLTKRCSLADLTVLRHSRRESMKKDSMMDDHRVPLKLIGARPISESRRCSVPVQAGEVSYGNVSPRRGSRKYSLEEANWNEYSSNRVRLVRRF